MKMLKLSLLVGGMLLLASHSSFAQNHIKIHSREQLATLNEQMCFYLEGHKPEFSHTKLKSIFIPGDYAGIEQPFESQGQYRIHVKVEFCDSEDKAKSGLFRFRKSTGDQGVFIRNMGNEAWISNSWAVVRKDTLLIVISLFETNNYTTPSSNIEPQNSPVTLQQIELEEVEIYNHRLKKFETIQTIKSFRRDYAREIVGLVLEFFEKYGN